MASYILLFKNTHEVIKADHLLEKLGFKREIIPTPKRLSSECGVSLKVFCDDWEKVLIELSDCGISITKIYDENLNKIWKR